MTRSPENDRAGTGEEYQDTGRRPMVICAITYMTRAQNLPPFYHAAISQTLSGFEVHGFGTTSRRALDPVDHIAPGFTFSRIRVASRDAFLKLPGWLGENVIASALQYLCTFVEYNVRMYGKARNCPADIVEAHDLPALPVAVRLARKLGKPLVYRAHELWSEQAPRTVFTAFWRWLERRLIGSAALVIVPEENRARILRDEYGAPELPLVVANCPPFRIAPPGDMLGELFAARGIRPECIVLYQGVINHDRCLDEIVAASPAFGPGVALTLIGQGYDEWSNPESRIPPGGRVIHIPHVPYDSLGAYTASAHIGLLFYRNTCRNNYYCAPNKLYEYMMMGLPVVTCNYPGLVPFVEGQGIGLCVDPEDPAAIAAAVNRIAGDPALRERMRENCLRLAKERWNWEREFPRLHDAYLSLTTRSTHQAVTADTVRAAVI